MKIALSRILFTFIAVIFLVSCSKEKDTRFYFKFLNKTEYEITMLTENPYSHIDNLIPDEITIETNGNFEWVGQLRSSDPFFTSLESKIECRFGDEYKVIFFGGTHKYSPAKGSAYTDHELSKHKILRTFTFTAEMVEYAKSLNDQGLLYAGSEDPGFVLPPGIEKEKE